MRAQEIHLARRPVGMPTVDDFTVVDVELEEPVEDEVVVANRFLSVDPYMRGRMVDRKSYVPPFGLGEPLPGGSIGEVVASSHPEFALGDHVRHMDGWRSHTVIDGGKLSKVDDERAPLHTYLGTLGMPGMTAYVGLLHIAELRDGDTVVVSGAAGAVGSVAGQIAKLRGCRVVGSAGSPEKVAWLTDELGFDAAFDHRETAYADGLDAHCPDGIDVVFENVGGDHLAAVVPRMRDFGRIALCGAISEYNATTPTPGPPMWPMIAKRVGIRGFIVSDHADRGRDFLRDVGGWLASGELAERSTIVQGLAQMPAAFIGLFTGANIGKMVVELPTGAGSSG